MKFDFWLVSANMVYFTSALTVVVFYTYTDLTDRGITSIIQSSMLLLSSLLKIKGYRVVTKKLILHTG